MPSPLYVRLFGTALALLLLIPRAGNSMGDARIVEEPVVDAPLVVTTTDAEIEEGAICASVDGEELTLDPATGTCELCGDRDTTEEEFQRIVDEMMAVAAAIEGDTIAATPLADSSTVY